MLYILTISYTKGIGRKQTGEVIVAYMPALNELTQLFLYGELDSNAAREVINTK